MNYNELFNICYSNIPESVKFNIFNKLPKELNESTNTYNPILEVLDILAYSEDITEEKANNVIDEIFSNIDEQVAEEILEAYLKEKSLQYIEETVAHGTDAIGLAGLKKEIHNKEVNRRAQNIQNIRTKRNIEKAVSGIKNAVDKVRDFANRAAQPTAKDYASAIGRKAVENEKAGKPNFKPNSYADRYSKAMKRYEDLYGKVSKTPETKSTNNTNSTSTSSNTSATVSNSNSQPQPQAKATVVNKEPEQQKLKLDTPTANKDNKKPAKMSKKTAQDVGDKIHKYVTDYVAKADKDKADREAKEKAEVEARKKKFEELKAKPKTETKVEAKKVEDKPKTETKVEAKKVENKNEDEIDKLMNSSSGKKRTREQQDRLDRHKEKVRAEKNYKNLENKIDFLKKAIAATEGKPSMLDQKQAKTKELVKLQKELQELKAQKVNEAVSSLAYLLVKTNISESSFVEVMQLVNPITSKKAKISRYSK